MIPVTWCVFYWVSCSVMWCVLCFRTVDMYKLL